MLYLRRMLSPTNSPFFSSQIHTLSFPINWPTMLAMPSFNSYLTNLRTLPIQRTYQSQAFFNFRLEIRSDQICDARTQNIPDLFDMLIAI